jgi:hypothetical protein
MATAPRWFLAGESVPDLELAAPDAPYILEDGEWDFDWRLVRVPAAILRPLFPETFNGGATLGLSGTTVEAEAERFAAIQEWMRQGGPDSQLEFSPPLMLLHPATGALTILDGWHRTALGLLVFALDAIPAIVAIGHD